MEAGLVVRLIVATSLLVLVSVSGLVVGYSRMFSPIYMLALIVNDAASATLLWLVVKL